MWNWNKVSLAGKVVADPSIKTSSLGKKIALFQLSTVTYQKEVAGKKEIAEYHSICVYNEHLASLVENYVSKGTFLAVDGASIKTNKYTDAKGIDRYKVDIIVNYGASIKILPGSAPKEPKSIGEQKLINVSDDEEILEDDEIPF